MDGKWFLFVMPIRVPIVYLQEHKIKVMCFVFYGTKIVYIVKLLFVDVKILTILKDWTRFKSVFYS